MYYACSLRLRIYTCSTLMVSPRCELLRTFLTKQPPNARFDPLIYRTNLNRASPNSPPIPETRIHYPRPDRHRGQFLPERFSCVRSRRDGNKPTQFQLVHNGRLEVTGYATPHDSGCPEIMQDDDAFSMPSTAENILNGKWREFIGLVAPCSKTRLYVLDNYVKRKLALAM